ncbi:MAG TPA: phage baseplate assembly protein V [Pyrinomonadaceae bacterium]|nr:phage baseplate assembly protein V [Pyrinomonadaceae bacterium]
MHVITSFDSPVELFAATYIAEVVSVQDPENLSRVQVRLPNFDGVADQDAAVWARVAVPFAGDRRGAFMLPDVGDEVLVSFINRDSRFPVVVGGLWNGNAGPPETLGGAGDRIDRWTIVGKAGSRIAIVEESPGQAVISFETPNGVSGELTDKSGGKIEFKGAGTTITVDTSGVSVQTPSKVKVQASQVEVTAGIVTVDSALSQFSGIVKCDVLQATTVIASTYTPGAGNIW